MKRVLLIFWYHLFCVVAGFNILYSLFKIKQYIQKIALTIERYDDFIVKAVIEKQKKSLTALNGILQQSWYPLWQLEHLLWQL